MTRKIIVKNASMTTTVSRKRSARPKVSTTGTQASAPKQPKKSVLTDLLKRPSGASMEELISATGWQAHSIRATISGLRKDGRTILLSKARNGGSSYRIA